MKLQLSILPTKKMRLKKLEGAQGLWQEIDNLFIRTVLNQSLRGLI